MSRNGVLIDLAENLFTHMRMIRRKTIGEEDRADRSIHDHMNIIKALEARDDRARRGTCARARAWSRRSRRATRAIISIEKIRLKGERSWQRQQSRLAKRPNLSVS